MEYNGKVLVWKNNKIEYFNEILTESDNPQEALKNIEEIVKKSFSPDFLSEYFIHVDQIYDSTGKIVYQTAWDEISPLAASFIL